MKLRIGVGFSGFNFRNYFRRWISITDTYLFLSTKGNNYEETSPISSNEDNHSGNGTNQWQEKHSQQKMDRTKEHHRQHKRPRTPTTTPPDETHGNVNLVGYPRSPPSGRPRTPEGPPPRDQSASPDTPDMRNFGPNTRIITPEYNSPDKPIHLRKSDSANTGSNRTNLTKRPITPPEPYPGSPISRHRHGAGSLVANEYGNAGDTDLSRSNSPPSMTAMLVANSNYRRPPSPPHPHPTTSDRGAQG